VDRLTAATRSHNGDRESRAMPRPKASGDATRRDATPCRNCGTPLLRIGRDEIALALTCPVCGLPYEPRTTRLRVFDTVDSRDDEDRP
jgi:hypothetical protein